MVFEDFQKFLFFPTTLVHWSGLAAHGILCKCFQNNILHGTHTVEPVNVELPLSFQVTPKMSIFLQTSLVYHSPKDKNLIKTETPQVQIRRRPLQHPPTSKLPADGHPPKFQISPLYTVYFSLIFFSDSTICASRDAQAPLVPIQLRLRLWLEAPEQSQHQ